MSTSRSTMMYRTRGRGERGIAILTTALVLMPLMIFAAYGVDLASWYSRVSYLQKSADAAALAGTVWMPNLTRSTTEACASLAQNGITGAPACGSGPFTVTVERGLTSTSLRVLVTDPDAKRYFSQVFSGQQSLLRSAEAEYNLPVPLGSPLNYFGGDAARTAGLTEEEVRDVVLWPTDYNQVVHAPVNTPCNIGTSAGQGLGRWTSATSFDAAGFSGSTRCLFEPRQGSNSGTITVAPPDYDRLTNVPTNTPCNAFGSGNGRWQSATVWNAGARYTSGTGKRQCSWRDWRTSSVPSDTYRSQSSSINGSVRPCNLAYRDVNGRWPTSGGYSSGNRFTGLHTAGNQFCQYYAEIQAQTFTIALPNPINSGRSPGFWAAIEGPQTRAFQGDAYSTRCYTSNSCTSDQSAMYLQPANVDRGFWYVVKIPAGLSGSVSLNVFDASYVTGGDTNDGAGDRTLDGGGDFTTTFRMYQQTNALDISQRTPVTMSAANTTEGSCNWSLFDETSFRNTWRNLCNLTVSPGQTYLLNVQTTGTTGAGVNGYALEAVAGNNHSNVVQPALYAYSNMGMQNNNSCAGSGCSIPPATFYLAEVGPQYAGRTLVMELWDSGDVGSGVTATMSPMRPSPTAPKPVVNVAAADCSYTADANPNSRISGTTGPELLTPQASDSGSVCSIRTTVAGAQRFNGEWLRIRISIPADYTCMVGVNPEKANNSCWWGIRYAFTGGSGSEITANDVTTWQARIEGNPVHLTE